jgi:hypothetical protein
MAERYLSSVPLERIGRERAGEDGSARLRSIVSSFFIIGVVLIPFDNLAFAPTEGWATISPIVFFLYFVLEILRRGGVPRIIVLALTILAAAVIYSFILFIFYPPHWTLFLKSLSGLGLGLSFFASLYLYMTGCDGRINRNRLKVFLLAVVVGYGASLAYGLLYIFAYEYNVSYLVELFLRIEARHYGGRYSFSFTEPSFISMHVFGVMFAAIVFGVTWVRRAKVTWWLVGLGLMFLTVALLFVDSVRLLVDLVVVSSLVLTGLFISSRRRWRVFSVVVPSVLAIMVVTLVSPRYLADTNPRIAGLLDADVSLEGVMYSDASLASRYFRAYAIVNGLIADPAVLLFGAGLSNSHYPFYGGYASAAVQYDHPYITEVEYLRDHPQSNYYVMALRLISEWGIIISAAIVLALWRVRLTWFFLPILYLYLQFDSYAFYAVWLYLYYVSVVSRSGIGAHSFRRSS